MFRAFWSLPEAAAHFGPCALTIGNFDGVHLGHRRILETVIARARAGGWKAAVLTFHPHPTRVVAPDRAPALMTTIEQRLERFAEIGIDEVLVMPFNAEIARLTPEEFVADVLVERLDARAVIVGSNFRFGHRHAGDVATLTALGESYDFDCEAVQPVVIAGGVVSSSRIRNELRRGRLREARRMLGTDFRIRGTVAPGRGIGGRQTVPTLNLAPDSELAPADGVYISETRDLATQRCWPSVTNVGVRPTFGAGERTIETHLLSPIDDRAPERIEIWFLRRVREERTFDSADQLKRQILLDITMAERYFRHRAGLRLASRRSRPASGGR
jgi:riboflavin kinase/FMN adenylyltransferase